MESTTEDTKKPRPKRGVVRKGGIENAPQVHEASQKKKIRGKKFKIPESARVGPDDPEVVVIRELKPEEQLLASKIAGDDKTKKVHESVKLSIHSVDGHELDEGSGEADFFWARWSAKVRMLVSQGFATVNASSDAEDAAFLSSGEEVAL